MSEDRTDGLASVPCVDCGTPITVCDYEAQYQWRCGECGHSTLALRVPTRPRRMLT